MGAFRRGFRNRNPLVLVVAALLLVPALLGFQWLFTSGAWTGGPARRRAAQPRGLVHLHLVDGRQGAAGRAAHAPGLYLLGGSSARESIVSGDALAAEIAELGGPRVAAYDLGSINQNFAQSLAVVDSAPDTPAWLLVGVNLGRFTATEEQNAVQAEGREFLLESDAVQDFVSSEWGLEKYSYTILPGIWAYITDWVRKHGARAARGRPAEHRVRAAPVLGGDAALGRPEEAARDEVEHEPQARLRAEPGRQPADARGAAGAGPRARRPRRAPRAAAQRGDRRRQLRRRRSGSTRSRSRRSPASTTCPYIDLNQTVDIPSRDFQDLSHLIAPGRVIWQHALAKELARAPRHRGLWRE